MTFQEYVAAELLEQSNDNLSESYDDESTAIVEIDYTIQE